MPDLSQQEIYLLLLTSVIHIAHTIYVLFFFRPEIQAALQAHFKNHTTDSTQVYTRSNPNTILISTHRCLGHLCSHHGRTLSALLFIFVTTVDNTLMSWLIKIKYQQLINMSNIQLHNNYILYNNYENTHKMQ